MQQTILVAGATGNLGARIVNCLLANGAQVRVIARPGSNAGKLQELEQRGVQVVVADMQNRAEVTKACAGVTCVVSALSGLQEVVIGTQKVLLDAAVSAGVPRFIPSDFSIDFTRLTPGENRNLDLRREFHAYLNEAPIQATTIFNGAFTELLIGPMPMILHPIKRILYYGSKTQRMDFTTMDNTAEFTAHAALDPTTPRFLHIAGDQLSPQEMAIVASEVTRQKFGLLRPGGLGLLNFLIGVTKKMAPQPTELYPAWQGMQYMRDMLSGRAVAAIYDNNRYPGINWTTVKEVLVNHLKD